MVFKRYIKRDGKLHGPYYYESYRENGKTKKRYIGTEPPKRDNRQTILVTPHTLIIFVVIALAVLFYVFHITSFFFFVNNVGSNPVINFIAPSPAEGSFSTDHNPLLNVSTSDDTNQTYSFFTDGLVAWYRFDNSSSAGENDTHVFDWGGGNNGTTIGGTSPISNGKFGGAFMFNGVDSYLDFGTSTLTSGATTVSMWFNYTGYGNAYLADLKIIIPEGIFLSNGLNCPGIALRDTTITMAPPDCSLFTNLNSTWVSFIFTYNGSGSGDVNNYKMYINGQNVSIVDTGPNGMGWTSNLIGNLNGGGPFNGSIDEVMIFNRTLQGTEIGALYNSSQYNVQRSFSFSSPVAQNYTVKAVNALGNLSIASRSWTIVPPGIEFVSPTPANALSTTNHFATINISVTESALKDITFNWNTTNYTMYNDSLVLMYNLDNVSAIGETETLAVDVSKYGNNGTITGDAQLNSSGKYGRAASFDGSGDTIQTAYKNWGFSTTYTFTAWIKTTSTDADAVLSLGHGSNQDEALLYTADSIIGILNHNPATDYTGRVSDTVINDGNWHFVAGAQNGSGSLSDLHIYVDGREETGTTSTVGSPSDIVDTTPRTFIVGGRTDMSTASEYYNGLIDEVRVWNRFLGADEIRQQYYSNLNKYDTDKWDLYVNQSNIGEETFTFQASATDIYGFSNNTEQRTLTVQINPQIQFVSPTSASGTSTTNTFTEINISTIEENLNTLVWNWNNANYTMYNDSLVIMYNFDNISAIGDNSTHVVDISQSTKDGIINGANYTNGKYGRALNFVHSNRDYVAVENSTGINPTSGLTVSAWFNAPANGQEFFGIIGKNNNAEHTVSGWDIAMYAGGNIGFVGGSSSADTTGKDYRDGIWHQVVGTWNGTLSSIYVDGVLNGTVAVTSFPASASEVRIGEYAFDYPLNNRSWEGGIDEVRVWNRSLSADEIRQQYYSNLNKYDTDKWQFYTNQSNLSSGTYNYFGYARDNAGNQNSTETRSITIGAVVSAPAPSGPGSGGGGGGGGAVTPAPEICKPSYSCSSWSACLNGEQTRTCTDSCTESSVQESEVCLICIPDWQCGDWGTCENDASSRTCSDTKGCGVDTGKPSESMSCTQVEKIVEGKKVACTPDVRCGDWSECNYASNVENVLKGEVGLTGYKERTCSDANSCISSFIEKSSCSSNVKIELQKKRVCGVDTLSAVNGDTKNPVSNINLETFSAKKLDLSFIQSDTVYCASCYNSIQDGDEERIDCGGSCKPCLEVKETKLAYTLSPINNLVSITASIFQSVYFDFAVIFIAAIITIILYRVHYNKRSNGVNAVLGSLKKNISRK